MQIDYTKDVEEFLNSYVCGTDDYLLNKAINKAINNWTNNEKS